MGEEAVEVGLVGVVEREGILCVEFELADCCSVGGGEEGLTEVACGFAGGGTFQGSWG